MAVQSLRTGRSGALLIARPRGGSHFELGPTADLSAFVSGW